MKSIILLLLIVNIIVAAPPPSPQYDGRSAGAMPCYLGCCKLIHLLLSIYFFSFFMNINFLS
jgi:hypothetical protein